MKEQDFINFYEDFWKMDDDEILTLWYLVDWSLKPNNPSTIITWINQSEQLKHLFEMYMEHGIDFLEAEVEHIRTFE